MKHIFTGNSLDRGDVERRNEDWIKSNSKSEDARYLTMSDLNPLVRLGSNSSAISWKAYTDVEQFVEEDGDLIFLGVKNNKPHFVMDLPVDKERGYIYWWERAKKLQMNIIKIFGNPIRIED